MNTNTNPVVAIKTLTIADAIKAGVAANKATMGVWNALIGEQLLGGKLPVVDFVRRL